MSKALDLIKELVENHEKCLESLGSKGNNIAIQTLALSSSLMSVAKILVLAIEDLGDKIVAGGE